MKQDNAYRALSMAPVHSNSGKVVVVAVTNIVEVIVTLDWSVTLQAAETQRSVF